MKALEVVALCGTVLALSAGQLLFKVVAGEVRELPFFWAGLSTIARSPVFLSAIVLYGAATLIWVWTLRDLSLGVAYPWMALTFLIVPLAASITFGEVVTVRTVMGGMLILAGIWVIGSGKT